TSLAKQCQTATKEEDLWICAGLDRPEFYACPFTGYLYATMAYFSGPYGNHPYQHDHMLLCSTDYGATWHVINASLGGPAPHVMTSTPNGRLFVYVWTYDADNFYGRLHCSNLFDFANKALPTVNLVMGKTFAQGGTAPNGWDVMFGELYTADLILAKMHSQPTAGRPPDPQASTNSQKMAAPAISRASPDVQSNHAPPSLAFLTHYTR